MVDSKSTRKFGYPYQTSSSTQTNSTQHFPGTCGCLNAQKPTCMYTPSPPAPPPPHWSSIPQGMTMQDWMQYINYYIDARLKQMYDKLAELYSTQVDGDTVRDYILLRDQSTGAIYKLFISGEVITTKLFKDANGNEVQGG